MGRGCCRAASSSRHINVAGIALCCVLAVIGVLVWRHAALDIADSGKDDDGNGGSDAGEPVSYCDR